MKPTERDKLILKALKEAIPLANKEQKELMDKHKEQNNGRQKNTN